MNNEDLKAEELVWWFKLWQAHIVQAEPWRKNIEALLRQTDPGLEAYLLAPRPFLREMVAESRSRFKEEVLKALEEAYAQFKPDPFVPSPIMHMYKKGFNEATKVVRGL